MGIIELNLFLSGKNERREGGNILPPFISITSVPSSRVGGECKVVRLNSTFENAH